MTHRDIACALVFLAILVGCGKQDPAVLLERALQAAQTGDRESWSEARDLLRTCRIKHQVVDPDVDALYIYALWRTDEHDEAMSQARKAIETHPTAFAPRFLLGKFLYDQDEFVDAIPYLRHAHKQNPAHLDCHILYAATAARLELDEAGQLLQALADRDDFKDTGRLSNELAIWHAKREESLPAFSHIGRAISLSDHHPLIWLNKARIADYTANKPELARKFYRQFILEAGEQYPEQKKLAVERIRALKDAR